MKFTLMNVRTMEKRTHGTKFEMAEAKTQKFAAKE